jgi:simple sugar transport system ATP-binding protein
MRLSAIASPQRRSRHGLPNSRALCPSATCSAPCSLDDTVALLVAANPCFGLDVKAVSEIRARIVAARNADTAVLMLSEDLDEILDLSDRIVVMREGSIVYETAGAGADARTIGGYMVGRA